MRKHALTGALCALGVWGTFTILSVGVASAADVRLVASVGRLQPVVTTVPPSISLTTKRFGVEKGSSGQKDANVTGDNVADPFVIASLPFNDAQSTAGFIDDYNETCPFPESGAPDVVYSYTPGANGVIRVDLCGSSYDTRVYVYANSVTAGSPYACNDDYCGDTWYRSRIPSLPVTMGTVYYIIVDGWGTASGNYQLSVTSDEACVWSGCSEGAVAEGEVCATGTDVTNGGCNLPSQLFSAINFDAPVCGEIWAQLPNRDTDWYRRTLAAGEPVRWKVRSSFPVSIFIFDLSGGCAALSGLRLDGDPCEEISITITPDVTGDFAFVVTTREQYGGYECASGPGEYEATLELACFCVCHADPTESTGPGTCDGVVNAIDIVTVVNIAFRGAPTILDPSSTCPWQRVDVDCNGVVNAIDLIRFVNVAFRGGEPSSEFCSPCAVE